MPVVPVDELKGYIGKELGRSEWVTIDQERINQFADCTGDHQFIHVDPEKAKKSPFGGTIAHGYLTLSLIPALGESIMVLPENLRMAVNYGIDKLRFINPVKVNAKVRLVLSLLEVTEKSAGRWLLRVEGALEIEGVDKPAYVAELLTLCFVKK